MEEKNKELSSKGFVNKGKSKQDSEAYMIEEDNDTKDNPKKEDKVIEKTDHPKSSLQQKTGEEHGGTHAAYSCLLQFISYVIIVLTFPL